MYRSKLAIGSAVAVGLLVAVSQVAQATPEPSAVPTSWELKLDPSAPMRIQVDTGHGPRMYWYMLYTVTNLTGEDIDFHPEIVRVNEIETEVPAEKASAMSDQASSITTDPAIVGLHSKVFAAIKERHAKTHPFMVTPVKAITRLLQGKDNALTSVAVFSDMDPRVSKFTIYFSGLSGERVRLANPAHDPNKPDREEANGHGADDNPRFFVLRKTLMIPYTLPGDPRSRQYADPVLGRMDWVMR